MQWASARGERREEGGEGRGECVDTLQWASKVGRREERTHSGRTEETTCEARQPRTSFFPMKKIIRVPFVSIRGSIIPPFVYFVVHSLLNVRAAEATRGRAQARQPRTTFFSLLPSPYFTENKRVVPSSVSCRISRASRSLIESSSSWYWVFSGGVKDSSAKRSLPFRSAIPSLSAGRSSR